MGGELTAERRARADQYARERPGGRATGPLGPLDVRDWTHTAWRRMERTTAERPPLGAA
jgi:hypothetical protein